jgi:hypothetical protein
MDTAATTPITPDRNELRLRNVRLDLEAIPELAAEWAGLTDGERASWSHTWDNDMGAVENLIFACRRGELTTEHERDLRELVRRLGELSAKIAAMGLWLPDLADLAAPAGQASRRARQLL